MNILSCRGKVLIELWLMVNLGIGKENFEEAEERTLLGLSRFVFRKVRSSRIAVEGAQWRR